MCPERKSLTIITFAEPFGDFRGLLSPISLLPLSITACSPILMDVSSTPVKKNRRLVPDFAFVAMCEHYVIAKRRGYILNKDGHHQDREYACLSISYWTTS